MKECPLKRLDITGNDFGKKVKKAYSEAIKEGVLSRFDDDEDEEEEVLRLFEEMKIWSSCVSIYDNIDSKIMLNVDSGLWKSFFCFRTAIRRLISNKDWSDIFFFELR